MVEVVDERSPSPVAVVATAQSCGVVEGVVWVLDEEDIPGPVGGVVGDVGHEEVQQAVFIDVGDIDPHRVGDPDALDIGRHVGESAVVVVDVVLGGSGVADDDEVGVSVAVHIHE